MSPELSRPDPEPSRAPGSHPGMEARARAILDSEAWDRARTHLLEDDPRTLDEQVALSEIPAPPFGEERRGRAMAALMAGSGLTGVEADEEGNVLAWYGEPGPAPVVVSAHLDTVFPEGTDVEVRREGGRLLGPGISDDARGLAALLALSRALAAAGIRTARPLLVVATVGEEGAGDLRGVRHLFGPGGRGQEATAFLSLDGAGTSRVVNQAVGARRWRMSVRGPGGHSWVDWGLPNPLHALSEAVARLARLELPEGMTLSVGRMGGGRSVNAIPEEAWMELEIRSRVQYHLAEASHTVRKTVEAAVGETSRAASRNPGSLELESRLMGDRPAGSTPAESELVQAAVTATRALGREPALASSSTDANVPMSQGIPAVTLGAGGRAGQAHTLEEWYDNKGGPEGILRALLVLLLVDETGPG